jgi:3-deoxy-7-phosphoheptulonate synthase
MNLLPSPAQLRSAATSAGDTATIVARQRREVADIIDGADDRLLVIVGPCSVHDPDGMREYAARLAAVAGDFADDLHLVVRVYTEKPRTRHGWPGLLLDPDLDGGCQVGQGIARTRALLSDMVELGLAVAAEFVEPMLAGYLSDLVSWGAIGARTVESPTHRRLASALDMPVGIKNRTDGALSPAVDAIAVASRPQPVLGVTDDGSPHWYLSDGNPHAHMVLRGGAGGNYEAHQVGHALSLLREVHPSPKLIVDCSHGNSGKDHRRQPHVARTIAAQVAAGQHAIAGIMLESYLHEGAQSLTPPLRHGVSVTDSCLSFTHTLAVLEEVASAVRRRRHSRRTDLVDAS